MMRTNDIVGLKDEISCQILASKYGENKDKIEKICKQFLQLCSYYDVWKTIKSFSHKHFCGIMNYWLNSDLKEINDKNKLKSDFYPSIMEESKKKLGKLDCTLNLYKIDDKEFYNLKIVYELYDNFYKRIHTANSIKTDVTCENGCIHKEKCAKIFNSNIDKCSSKNSSKFCKALKQFRRKYVEESICHKCPNITPIEPYPIEEEAIESVAASEQVSSKNMVPVLQEAPSDLPAQMISQHTVESETQLPPESSNMLKKISHSALAGATVLFTSSVLYRVSTYFTRNYKYNVNL
ncbi:hypothetical protein PVNG_04490 [Plasmodium vivax North Korean]|uniref:Uncharacterized protein n=1 Tax=Plasmodium vivax North Korean TaxID=1035514 RepID=A0A0J9WFE3_PLAVI|nr:hypothetical protein PVNG_04490 [Plasmodium vivax North Korean]